MEDKLKKMTAGQGGSGTKSGIFDRTLPQDINLAGTGLGVQKRLTGSSYQNLVNNLGDINTRVAGEMGYNDRGNLKPIVVDASVKDNSVRTSSSSAFISGGTATNMQDQFSGGRVAAGT